MPKTLLATLFVAAVLPTLGACSADGGPVVLRFDRAATSVVDHPFPDDRYRQAGTGLLYGFSDAQLAATPFLLHLPLTAQIGWWSNTTIRLPVTPAPGESSRWVDPDTVPAAVALYRLDPDGGAAVAVDLVDHAVAWRTGTITFRPAAPLVPATYGVLVRADVLRTRGGQAVIASSDYEDVIEAGDPDTDAGFALVVAADGSVATREDSLAYFQLTVDDDASLTVLLQAYVEGKAPVDRLGADEILDVTALLPFEDAEIAIGAAQVQADGPEQVAAFYEAVGLGALPTAGIGRIVGGLVSLPRFVSDDVPDTQALFTNETFLAQDPTLPFLPDNPLSLSASAPFGRVPYLAFFPEASITPPPVVLAIHGFALSKESFLSLASALCSSGHAVVAIDNYQHGSRQADIELPEGDVAAKLDPVLLGLGIAFPDPFINPTFLARSRDKVRQSVVDQLAVVRLLAAADGTNAAIDIDGDTVPDDYGDIHIVGESLGGIVGTIMAAVSPHIARAVLNVPGADIAAIVRDSPYLSHDTNLLAFATASADGIGLMSGVEAPFLPDSEEREVYDIVAATAIAAADAGTYGPRVLDGALGGAMPRVLVQFAAADTVIPQSASRRFARSIAAGAPAEAPLELVVDGQVNQAYFELDALPIRDISEGLPPSFATVFPGEHAFLIDFADPTTTGAAQLQVVQFLVAP